MFYEKKMSGSVTAEQNLYKGLSSSRAWSQKPNGCEKARQARSQRKRLPDRRSSKHASRMDAGLVKPRNTRDCHVARVSRKARRLGV